MLRTNRGLCKYIFLSLITFGIAPLVWFHKLSNRIGDELLFRRIDYSFSADSFWGWYFFGSLIIVGPFIYFHKLLKAMNLINGAYNTRMNAAALAGEV